MARVLYSRVTTQPTFEPVTSSEAKTHLRVEYTYDDTYISNLITAARQRCEMYAGLSIPTQTRLLELDSFPSDDDTPIILPYGPVASISSVAYTDEDGAAQTWSGTLYSADISSELCRLYPTVDESYPDTDESNKSVRITYVAGYSQANTPMLIKQAVLLEVGNLYENRGDGDMSQAARSLLDFVKVYWHAEQEE